MKPLLYAAADLLDQTPAFPLYEEEDEAVVYKFEPKEKEFDVSKDEYGRWILTGEKLIKLFKMTNMDHDESVMRFARQLRGMGIDEKLRQEGAVDGDIVRIEEFEFEFVD